MSTIAKNHSGGTHNAQQTSHHSQPKTEKPQEAKKVDEPRDASRLSDEAREGHKSDDQESRIHDLKKKLAHLKHDDDDEDDKKVKKSGGDDDGGGGAEEAGGVPEVGETAEEGGVDPAGEAAAQQDAGSSDLVREAKRIMFNGPKANELRADLQQKCEALVQSGQQPPDEDVQAVTQALGSNPFEQLQAQQQQAA